MCSSVSVCVCLCLCVPALDDIEDELVDARRCVCVYERERETVSARLVRYEVYLFIYRSFSAKVTYI